jgi:hypothetical protein
MATAQEVLTKVPGDDGVKELQNKHVEGGAAALSNHAQHLLEKMKQPRACVRDPEGYIDCGPIVGYPRGESGVAREPKSDIEKIPGDKIHNNKVLKDEAPLKKD